jgi:DNA-binding MarR family transcriptional regulator
MATEESFDLGGYLPYLLNRAGSRIATAFTAEVRGHGITLPMWRALAALYDHGEGARVSWLSDRTSIEVSTLSRVLDGLEGKKLVRRRRAVEDARAVHVELTAAGARLTMRIIPLARRYEEVALAGFSKAETRALKGLLMRLYDNMAALEMEAEPGRRAG